MKVVLGCLNSKYIHRSSAPWCLAAGVREFGPAEADCRVMENTINGNLEDFACEIVEQEPDVVTFSCYIWNIRQTLLLCRRIKDAWPCVIALGGPEVSYRAKEVLAENPSVDYVLSGEGEFAFPPFLQMLSEQRDPQEVAGLFYRDGEEIHTNPEGVYTDDPPSPYSVEYLQSLGGRICYIETARGCPYRCAFCLSGRLAPYRIFSDQQALRRDLLLLAQSGSRTVKFVDRTFNANEAHANGILSFIAAHYGKEIPSGVCFHFEIAGDILKESTMKLLEQMPYGAVQLEIGMQSFHEPTLTAICRRTDTQKLIKNIQRLLSFGNMHIHIDLIAGLTGEGMQEFEQSVNTAFSLRAHMLQMGFLKLLHGAPMREETEKYPCTFSAEPPYEVSSTPWLCAKELLRLKKCEDALERMYNSGHFLWTLDYLLEALNTEPFPLLMEIGEKLDGHGMALDAYAEGLFGLFAARCDGAVLQECLVSDLLCSASPSQVPKSLRLNDPRHKKAAALLAKGDTVKVQILKQKNQILVVEPEQPRDLFGRYPYRFLPLSFDIE
ncbi:MAG: DUF4080 domain-containing protein [Clostridia bacterium]|nr:DUF4080 domain-containing protein [Clostridia bacterium]